MPTILAQSQSSDKGQLIHMPRRFMKAVPDAPKPAIDPEEIMRRVNGQDALRERKETFGSERLRTWLTSLDAMDADTSGLAS